MKSDSQRGDGMAKSIFQTSKYRSKLSVARSEDDSYEFAVSERGQHSIVALDRPEVEALVTALSELLDSPPAA